MGINFDDDPVPVLPVTIEAPIEPNSQIAGELPSLIKSIEDAVNAIPAEADGAIIGHWSRNGGWIGAVVLKAPGGFNVKGWVGDEAGARLDYGVGVVKTLKW